MPNILQEGLYKIGFRNDDNTIDNISKKIETYIKELQLFNSAYNLVNTSNFDDLVIRHIFDSIVPYKIINSFAKNIASKKEDGYVINVGDIGSGAGLPGIPLSIIFPQFNFTLVERMDKRCAFLENCIAILKLENVCIKKSEVEQVAKESFDITVFRAFRPLDIHFSKSLLEVTKTNGYLLAYKAKKENIKKEMESVKDIIPKYTMEKLSVPYLENAERNLVIIEK